MGWFNDFQYELISQTKIVFYIQEQFEKELNALAHLLNLNFKLKPEILYNNNSKLMNDLILSCENVLYNNLSLYLESNDLPAWVKDIDMREPVGELIEYCVESIENESNLTIEELKNTIFDANEIAGENYYDFTDEQLKDVLEVSQIIYANRNNNELTIIDEKLELLKTAIKLVDNSSSSNIFRQAFINMFSIFDAYIFDCLKIYFYKNSNELDSFFENKNNEKIKVSIDDVVKFNTIDDLKADIIQKQLNGKYLSEIISKLHKHKPELFNYIHYEKLMEMIERRNIHIHNKGYVDEKYFNHFNIYKLNVGDYAFIDNNYLLIEVFNTLSTFSSNLNDLIK